MLASWRNNCRMKIVRDIIPLLAILVIASACGADNATPKSAPTHRAGAVAATVQGKIYLIGGVDPKKEFKLVEEYDPSTGEWIAKSAIRKARFSSIAVQIDGYIYVIGGVSGNNVLSSMERYDPTSDSWVTLAPMPTARWNLMGAAAGGKIFAIGGITGTGNNRKTTDAAEVYDPVTDEWSPLSPMPIKRSGAATAVLGNRIFMIGGRPEAGPNPAVTNTVYVYDLETREWAQGVPFAEPRTGSCVAVINDEIYIVSGGAEGVAVSSIEIFDPKAGVWSTSGNLSEPRTTHACAVIGNDIHVLGGLTFQDPPILAKSVEVISLDQSSPPPSLGIQAESGTEATPIPAPGATPREQTTVLATPGGEAVVSEEEQTTVLPTPKVEKATPTPTPNPKVAKGPLAPEVVGITAWINSEPLKISDLRGKVVLVDFWTYTCVNCIRTFPYLKIWHAKYADDGLVILGVHTPEFRFEEKLENVKQAVKDNGIGWSVALDNDYATWRAYENRFWPAKYLIDKDGVVRYTHFGEGAYIETELKIRKLLEESGADLSELDAELPDFQPLDPGYLKNRSARPTRELYAGWERGYNDVQYGSGGYVGHGEYYGTSDAVITYQDPDRHAPGFIYLQGPWYNNFESLRHGRETSQFEDYISLKFSARSVNAVIKPEAEGAEPFKVLVTLDGEFLTASNKGADVVIEEDGRSFLYVEKARMFSVIQAPTFGTYELKLRSNSPDFALFAFTFGNYESGV